MKKNEKGIKLSTVKKKKERQNPEKENGKQKGERG